MNQLYIEPFDVRIQDLDAWGRLRTRSLLHYMEQTATDMSVAVGLDQAWYADQGTAWAMRQMRLQRLAPVNYRDDLTVAIWVSNTQRVRLTTDYEIRRRDGTPVAVGRGEWVYIDRSSRRPHPLDPAIIEKWPQQAPSSLWTDRLVPLVASSAEDEREPHTTPHPVYCYDAEAVGVTNYAVYADWFEEAAWEALRSWGYPLAPPTPSASGPRIDLQNLSLQYLLPTRPGDTVTITTWLTRADPQQVTLTQNIRPGGYPVNVWSSRAPTEGNVPEALVQAETVYQLVNNTAE
jgi:acyl-CoA thioesterase FadM